jgi:thiol:disulfide interchange protein DsbD
LVGAAAGAGDPLRPLQPFTGAIRGTAPAETGFVPVRGVAGLERALAQARAGHRPALLDFYADWCVSCVKMEREVFPDPAVRSATEGMVLMRADITANDDIDRELKDRFGVYGPPTLLFFDAEGNELRAYRLVGEQDARALAAHLHTLPLR